MIEIKRVLCPVDFSEFSRRGLSYAIALARWYRSTVTVLHVHRDLPHVDMIPSLTVGPARRIMLDEIERAGILEAERTLVREAVPGDVPVEVALEEGGEPPRVILERACALDADLIVMGSHGRSGYERLLLGSVTEKILHKAPCPVMVVPHRAEHPTPVGDVQFRRILCGIDFSDCSLAALEYALSVAEEADAQLTLVHVIETRSHFNALPPQVASTLAQINTEEEADAAARLQALVPESVRPFCTIRTGVTHGHQGWADIVRLAIEGHADLIVLGAHGHGAVERTLFGSTTHRVLRDAPCPVLTVRRIHSRG
jgi:nucleotide-binding universal stress UspA family protein